MTEERFIRPTATRNVVYFLGAGASAADGAPLQAEVLPRILDSRDVPCELGDDHRVAVKFVKKYFAGSVPPLEDVFGLVDYLVTAEESLGPEYTLSSLREIRLRLVRLIHWDVGLSQEHRRGVYRRFWQLTKDTTLNIGIVTTNYDTMLDEEFGFLYPNHALIDYCIPFMNYDWHGTDQVTLDPFDWWVDPREPVPIWDRTASPVPVKIIKIHGSLNWHECPACGQVLLRPWSTTVPGLNTPAAYSRFAMPSCPWDGEQFRPLIVPPSHIRTLHRPVLARLRGEAAREIRRARHVVFVGYSFPAADVHLKALLTKNLAPDCRLTVVDPRIDDRIHGAYESLNRQTEYVPRSFEDAIDDPDVFRRIASE